MIVVWATSGPVFHFSDTWQLVINTGTTIVTFVMVFVIQNTQNRDGRAVQTKLDAILEALDRADPELLDLEDSSDADIDREQDAVRARARTA
ncbi:MAG: low affinity iron permease family protein [Acidimicrobiales bacterium]